MWYGEDGSHGTIAATNGSPTIAGTGTAWLTNKAAPGDLAGYGLLAPLTSDALLYSIDSISADGAMTLGRNFQGSTASGLTYAIVPINGPTVELLEDIDTLLNSSSYSALNAAVSASSAGDFFQNVGGTITNRTTIQTLLALFNGLTEVNVASATNCNIGAAASPKVSITGNTTIASLNPSSGTMYPNALRWVRFTGTPNLTAGSTLILPTGLAAAAAGDTAIFISDGSSPPVWRCWAYMPANGQRPNPAVAGTTGNFSDSLAVGGSSPGSGGSKIATPGPIRIEGSTGASAPLLQLVSTGHWTWGVAGDGDNLIWKYDGNQLLKGTVGGPLDITTLGQIKFPATQNASSDANTLDDYEEGTFTPSFSTSGGSPSITMGSVSGKYTKIGRQVTVSGSATLTSFTGSPSGRMFLTGMPFTSISGQGGAAGLVGNGLDTSISNICGQISPADTVVGLYKFASGIITDIGSLLKNGQSVDFTVTYFTT